ncbi:aminotransferase class V-fold PLP-dependent enzyme [Nitratireductor thuwali]|uniref:dTDP-4-amino-4,6-dideoxygalactose transaminase n=1 Tax=Nitratireductor thuwali TaxID=2267699 RepID=A0ABY5MMW2_9HYPH|nr:dTDP-4-amino-4,6-dideoxygalactose transaminase [Nitratireductor thuwali]
MNAIVKAVPASRRLPFHVPHRSSRQAAYVGHVLSSGSLRPGGAFSREAEAWLVQHTGAEQAILTHSCTGAMEMAALALGLGPGDEVIVPTFTFCATATAFERAGARIVFCDIDPATMMIDPEDLERRITRRTRAIVAVHYGGASADMEAICAIARRHGVHVIEDAAQAFGSTRGGRAPGTFSTFGAFSFHETKVVSCGQGGALIVNAGDPALLERVAMIVERGTDHARVRSGEKAFYEWTSPGSSFQPGEFEAAILMAEFEALEENLAHRRRIATWMIERLERMALPFAILRTDAATRSNFHFIAALARNEATAASLMAHLQSNGIDCRQHYVPLHLSPARGRWAMVHARYPVPNKPGGVSCGCRFTRACGRRMWNTALR